MPSEVPERPARAGTFRRIVRTFKPYRGKVTLVAVLILVLEHLAVGLDGGRHFVEVRLAQLREANEQSDLLVGLLDERDAQAQRMGGVRGRGVADLPVVDQIAIRLRMELRGAGLQRLPGRFLAADRLSLCGGGMRVSLRGSGA